jgi:trypsin
LRQVSVPIINNQGCKARVTLPTKQICAGYDEGGKDSCQGDSGGPLIVDKGNGNFELVGIVSFGIGCAYKGEPGMNIKSFIFDLLEIF